jgi:FixJ family two-component response regulator
VSEVSIISIVDDDESVREALESLVRSVGLRAEAFASADAFLRSGRVGDTSCLILDVRMPGTDGLEFHRRLADAGTRIPTIFITAHGDEALRARALDEGAVAFLRKPFAEEALLRAIRTAIDRGRSGPPTPV